MRRVGDVNDQASQHGLEGTLRLQALVEFKRTISDLAMPFIVLLEGGNAICE